MSKHNLFEGFSQAAVYIRRLLLLFMTLVHQANGVIDLGKVCPKLFEDRGLFTLMTQEW